MLFFLQLSTTLCFIVFSQRWCWQYNSNLLYIGESVQSCVNIVSYFVSLCFTSFVKTLLLFPVSLQLLLQPSIFHPFSLKTTFLLLLFLLDHDNIFLSRNLYFCIICRYYYEVPLRLPKYLLYTKLGEKGSLPVKVPLGVWLQLAPLPCVLSVKLNW